MIIRKLSPEEKITAVESYLNGAWQLHTIVEQYGIAKESFRTMEGFWGILKCEMYYLSHFDTYEELMIAVEQFIHYYNHQWRQHKLNCLPPATYRSLLEAA